MGNNSDKKIKILVMHPELVVGGAERVLINFLNKFNRNLFDIDLLVRNKGCWDDQIPKDICVEYIYENNPNVMGGVFARYYKYGIMFFPQLILPKKIYSKKYDIVISFHEPMIWFLKCFKSKKISWCHADYAVLDYFPEVKQLKNKKGYLAKLINKKKTKLLKQLDKIVFVAESARDAFVKKTNISSKKTCILYNLNNEERVIELAQDIIVDKKWNEYKGTHLCAVGRIAEEKAFYRLVLMMLEIKKRGIDAKLFIIGDGPQREELELLIEDNKLEEDIILMGASSNPYKYIKNAKLLICSSAFEAYCTVTKESIILETPFVTTACSGMKEQVADTKAGLIVENGDGFLAMPVINILNNSELYNEMKVDIKKRHAELSDEKALENIHDFLVDFGK